MRKIISIASIFAVAFLSSFLLNGEGIVVATIMSTAIAGATTEGIRSLYDFRFSPTVMEKLYKTYGQGSGFMLINEFREAAGLMRQVSNDEMTGQEEDFWVRTITTGAQSSGGATAGAEATFTLSDDDIDSDGNYYPREKFSVWVQNGTTKVECRITDITVTAGPTVTLTIKPYDSNRTIGTIAAGTEMSIGPSAFGSETTQPEGTTSGLFEREFEAQIFKETKIFGGVELAKQRWVEKEGVGYYNLEQSRGEFMLDMQEEQALIFGQPNTNSITDTSSIDGNSVKVRKAKGVWTWIEELGGEVNYSTASGFGLTNFYSVEDYMLSQGVTSDFVQISGGKNLIRQIESALQTWVASNSAGTDYTYIDNQIFGGRKGKTLDTRFGVVKVGNTTYLLRDLGIFNNPALFNISTYNMVNSGFAFPLKSMVKDRKSGMTIPNLSAGYVGLGKYSRRRVVRTLDGMSGFTNTAVNAIDGLSTYWLSHLMYPFMEANKACLIKPSA